MALAHCVFDATNENTGALLSNVLVEVRLESSGALVECHSDRDGTVSLGTSFTVSDGRVSFFAVGGAYKITLTAPGHSRILRYVANGTSAETDVGVVNFAGYTYSFETGTSAPPSTASFRANNADLTAATELYFDDDTLAGNDISSILLSLAPVTGYATNQIRLTDPSSGAQFVANVTAVSDDTDYVTLTISSGIGATSMTTGSVKMDITWGGKSGANAGYRLQFSTTTTDGNPGAGKFRADNVTYGSITKLWVNEADYDGLDITSWLTSFDDNVNAIGRGNLIIQDQGDTTSKFGFSVTGPVVDKTGYREIPVSPMSGAMPANDTIMIANFTPSGADGSDGASGIDGASNFTRVQVVDTSEGSPASDYEAGDTVDGVVLAENDLVLRATSAGDPADGVYLVPTSGVASRLTAFDSYDSLPGTGFRVMEGTAKANTVWFCESAQGGTLDTTDLVFAEFSGSGGGSNYDTDLALLAMWQAETDALANLTGAAGNRFSDSFGAVTYVETSGAVNLDTSETGCLKASTAAGLGQTATHTSATASGNTVSASSEDGSYPAWKSVDKVTGGTSLAGCWHTVSVTGWWQYQFGAAKNIGSYTILSSNGYSNRAPNTWTLLASNTGAFAGEEVTLDSRSGETSWTSGGELREYTVASPGLYTYYRINVTANDGGGSGLSIDEVELLSVGLPNNLTVESKDIPITSVPTTLTAWVIVEEIDSVAANTDFAVRLGRDAGTTFSSATLSFVFERLDGYKVYKTQAVDVSGQPSGTTPTIEFTTSNNKTIKMHGWSILSE